MHALSQGGDGGEKILLCYGLLWKWALSFAKNCQGWMLFELGEFFQQCLNTLCNPLAHLIGMSLKFAAIHTTNTLVRQPNIFRCEGHQSCSISMFRYQFNINYPVCLLINTNININYFQEGLSISILYQLLKKLPYQFQYQYILSISPYDIVKITNFLSISHCYQYQCWYQLSK